MTMEIIELCAIIGTIAGSIIGVMKYEIKRLCNIPREEMNEWYYEMKDILIHNQKHLLNFEYSDFKRIERVL